MEALYGSFELFAQVPLGVDSTPGYRRKNGRMEGVMAANATQQHNNHP
jgi:hypothetical protein